MFMVGCQSTTTREIAEYVGRPQFKPFCHANGDGTCFRDGELELTENMACGDIKIEYKEVQNHIEDIEYRLYTCLTEPEECK